MKKIILKICFKILRKYGNGLYYTREGKKPFIELSSPKYEDNEWHHYIRTIMCWYKYDKNREFYDDFYIFERPLTKAEVKELSKRSKTYTFKK